MNPQKRSAIFARLQKANPDPRSELDYATPFELLVAVVLSAQATDKSEALEALPGVGRKTANVILNIAFGQPTIAVDTHIFRVSNRTGIAPGKDVRAVEERLLRFVPEPYRMHAHHWLILHGRYVCKARKPDCPRCPINDLCEYRAKTRVQAV